MVTIEDTAIRPLNMAGIIGLQDKFRVFQNSKDIGTVLVFFNETGAAYFFKEPMNELFGESVSLENLVKLYTSKSPLEKRFRKIVGASPKKFDSIVWLNALLKDYHLKKTLTELGYEAGYFDQTHFIHDFKIFTGETPEGYFGSIS